MGKYLVDCGTFPIGITGCRILYTTAKLQGYIKLADSIVPRFEVEIGEAGAVYLRAHPMTKTGIVLPEFREFSLTGGETVIDRDNPTTATVPAPSVTQDGPLATVQAQAWRGSDMKEYDVEVRTSDTSTAAAGAVTHGIFPASDPVTVMLPPDETSVRVHHRLTRKVDGANTGWTTTAVSVAAPDVAGIADHSTDFAGGTLETADGQAVLEINGGDLRQKALVIDACTTGVIDDYTSVVIIDAGNYWSPAVYTTANLVMDATQDIILQLHPKITSVTRATRTIDDWAGTPICWPVDDGAGALLDNRIVQRSNEGMVDATPVQVDWSVATSTSAAPTFVDADFIAYYPGKALPAVRTYAVRASIKTWHDRLVTIDEIQVRRWIFCKARPWCSHSSGGQLLYHTTLGADTTVVDWTVTGAAWDELICEVEWICNFSTDTEFELHINGTSTNDVVPSGQSVLIGDYERLRFRILPKIGRQRRTILDYAYKFDGATGALIASATAGLIDEWTDTSTEITSIRFTTDDHASTALGTGTTIRVWGRRYFDGA